MKITKKKSTYKNGPNKGVTTTSYKCQTEDEGRYSLEVTEIIDEGVYVLSFANTYIMDFENIADAFIVAQEIFNNVESPRIDEMRKVAVKVFSNE